MFCSRDFHISITLELVTVVEHIIYDVPVLAFVARQLVSKLSTFVMVAKQAK